MRDLIGKTIKKVIKEYQESNQPDVRKQQESNVREQQRKQLDIEYGQLQESLQQLKDQLEQKQALLRSCCDCHEQMVASKRGLETMLENAYSLINTQLNLSYRAKVLSRSYDSIKLRLDGPKVMSAVEEIEGEKEKLEKRIGELEEDIGWLKGEIAKKESDLGYIELRGQRVLYG